jgi:hypothetical protein
MLSPRILPDEMYGPNYVWDNKGMPRRVDEPPARQYYNAPPVHDVFTGDFMPLGMQNALYMLNSIRPQPDRVLFPETMNYEVGQPARPPEDDDIDQRMMLPSGMEMPNEMYGPNYNWDTKGWPLLRDPSVDTVRYPVRNRLPAESPVHFPEDNYRR